MSFDPTTGNFVLTSRNPNFPSARAISGTAGSIRITDNGSGSTLVISPDANLLGLSNLSSSGLVSYSPSLKQFFGNRINSADSSISITNPGGGAGGIDLSVNDDTSIQRLIVSTPNQNGSVTSSTYKELRVSSSNLSLALSANSGQNRTDLSVSLPSQITGNFEFNGNLVFKGSLTNFSNTDCGDNNIENVGMLSFAKFDSEASTSLELYQGIDGGPGHNAGLFITDGENTGQIYDSYFNPPSGGGGGGSGTVTSIGITSTNNTATITGSPVTTSGNINIAIPNWSTVAPTQNINVNSFEIISSGTIRAETFGIGSLLLEQGQEGIYITDGTNYGNIYDSHFNPPPGGGGGSGTVTSIGITSNSSGLTVSNSPITTSGNIALTLKANWVADAPNHNLLIAPTGFGSAIGGNNFIAASDVNNTSSATFQRNTIVGMWSENLNDITSGSSNTGFGCSIFKALTTGGQNTVVGDDSLNGLTTGSANIVLGVGSGNNLITESNNLIVGNIIDLPASSEYMGVIGKNLSIGMGMDFNQTNHPYPSAKKTSLYLGKGDTDNTIHPGVWIEETPDEFDFQGAGRGVLISNISGVPTASYYCEPTSSYVTTAAILTVDTNAGTNIASPTNCMIVGNGTNFDYIAAPSGSTTKYLTYTGSSIIWAAPSALAAYVPAVSENEPFVVELNKPYIAENVNGEPTILTLPDFVPKGSVIEIVGFNPNGWQLLLSGVQQAIFLSQSTPEGGVVTNINPDTGEIVATASIRMVCVVENEIFSLMANGEIYLTSGL